MFLRRIRARRPSRTPKRLLLLRVFGRPGESEGLLDALADIWRRIGAVDLLAGWTLRSSILETFRLRRSTDRFLKTDDEVGRWLLDLRAEVEGDSRYPVNSVYCHAHVWQRAFARLTQDAAVVLMDLRGFTSEHEGCRWELGYLVQHTPLRRILLLVDDDPERRAAIEREAELAWENLSLDSPNASAQQPELKILSYNRRREADRHKLLKLLLTAAEDSTAA
jgi:hypothetical protein